MGWFGGNDDDDSGEDYDDATSMTDDEADDAAWAEVEDNPPEDNSDCSGNVPDDND